MANVKIIADSTCDLGGALCARYDIAIAPLYVTLGEDSFRDGVEKTVGEVLDYCERTHETPKTAATSVGDFIELFRPWAEAGRDIVFIAISAQMSAEVQNAALAAREFPGRVIRCVDSQSLSTGIGLLVIEAAERAEAGMDANRIADEVEALRGKVRAGFVLDTLTYLRRGGRCSSLTALGAAMLNIKPEIAVSGGAMKQADKFRGNIRRVALRYAEKQLNPVERIRPRRVFITSCRFPEDGLDELEAYVRSLGYFEEVFRTEAGCVISSHCGPGCVGVLFLEK